MTRTFLRSLCLGLLLFTLAAASAQQPKPDATALFINEYLTKQWQAQKLTPAEPCSDEEFVRRATLDIIGRVATPDEVNAFVKNTTATKRLALVDKLLASPEYAHYWAGTWTNWLVPRSSLSTPHRNQLYFALKEQFAAPKMNHKDLVEKLLSASGPTSSNQLGNFIVAHRGLANPKDKAAEEGPFDMVPLTSRTLRLFLGYRLVAYQLPDHPVHPDFKPEQFWSVNAFFRQTDIRESAAKVGPQPWDVEDKSAFNPKGQVSYPDKDGTRKTAGAVFLDGRKLSADGKQTRRQVLAGFVTSHDNFAKAHANRLWGHFFGRGLHERPAVDDFGSHHKVLHPELLDRLAKDFTASGHDPRQLIRSICASSAYQLKSTSNPTNVREELEVYFSRMPLKIMTPEQLLESLLGSVKADDAEVRKLRAAGQEHLARRGSDADWADLSIQERIIQIVAMLNQKEISDAVLKAKTGPVARASGQKDPAKVLDELYLTALNRRPSEKESKQLGALIDKEMKAGKDLANLWEDLYWALLNSSEFIFNH